MVQLIHNFDMIEYEDTGYKRKDYTINDLAQIPTKTIRNIKKKTERLKDWQMRKGEFNNKRNKCIYLKEKEVLLRTEQRQKLKCCYY